MLGLISWMSAAAVAIAAARFVRSGRRPLWVEITVGIIAALLAGIAATALDFGGWSEADPRAFTFSLLVALAALGLLRALKGQKTDG